MSFINDKLLEIKWGFWWGWFGLFTVFDAWKKYLDGEFNQNYDGSPFRNEHEYFWFIFCGNSKS